MNFKKINLFLLLFLFCTSCSTTTIDLKKSNLPLSDRPSFSDYRSFIFFGFFQSRHVSVGKACLNQAPVRLKSYASGEDILLGLFTLGIYTSLSVEIWCEDSVSTANQEVKQ